VEYNPFPDMGGCVRLPGPQGFAVHRKSPHWRCFLGDRTSVCVMLGSGTATLDAAGSQLAFSETALRRKNSCIDDLGQAAVT
jgi:hypothetical protein